METEAWLSLVWMAADQQCRLLSPCSLHLCNNNASGIIARYMHMSVSNFNLVLNQIILSRVVANLEAFLSPSNPTDGRMSVVLVVFIQTWWTQCPVLGAMLSTLSTHQRQNKPLKQAIISRSAILCSCESLCTLCHTDEDWFICALWLG